ncbi:36222_t:CDS:2, partial [Gigaspora margarita]
MTNRVKTAEYNMETMTRNIDGNKDKFCQQGYYLAFKNFENILINVRDYTKKILKLKGYKKYLNATEVKNKYENLTKEYDRCMKELHFAIDMANKDARDEEGRKVEESLNDIEETLKNVDMGVKDANHKLIIILFY